MHISKRTGEFVPGSPLNALNVEDPGREFHALADDFSVYVPATKIGNVSPDATLRGGRNG